jgi:hypothetical protein
MTLLGSMPNKPLGSILVHGKLFIASISAPKSLGAAALGDFLAADSLNIADSMSPSAVGQEASRRLDGFAYPRHTELVD